MGCHVTPPRDWVTCSQSTARYRMDAVLINPAARLMSLLDSFPKPVNFKRERVGSNFCLGDYRDLRTFDLITLKDVGGILMILSDLLELTRFLGVGVRMKT